MLKNINWSQVVASIIVTVVVSIIMAKLTKNVIKPNGTTASYVGNDSIGWI